MDSELLRQIITRVGNSSIPLVEFIRQSGGAGSRLGIFSSSFNPTTAAHIALMRSARDQVSLDEIVALAGAANADKSQYECALEDRLRMLMLATVDDRWLSIAVSSHAYFVDMITAFERARPDSDLHFIIGFDTFERVLDRSSRYTPHYHAKFRDRGEALDYLAYRSWLVVAGRKGVGRSEIYERLKDAPLSLARRVKVLDVPDDLGDMSATEVRERVRDSRPIAGLVAPSVERYIVEHGLYH
jgi:nicotinate-nucleotide adenylyltransferase